MSLFLETQVEVGSGYRAEVLAWHPRHALLAVASFAESLGGDVCVFDEEGVKVEGEQVIRRPATRPTALAWNPDKKILAVGWANGEITTWNIADEGIPVFAQVTPKTEITHLSWSSNGFRIIIIDSSGLVVVYKVDHRGSIHSSPFSKQSLNEPASALLLKPPPLPKHMASDDRVAQIGQAQLENGDALDMFARSKGGHEAFFVNIGSSDSSTFFIGSVGGGVWVMKESGALNEGPAVGRPILKLLFFQERSALIVISEDLMLHQFSVSHDNSCQPLIQVKLTEKLSHFQAVWTRAGVLALSSGSNRVRLWDLENENNGLLQLTTLKGYGKNEVIQVLDYSKAKGILAAGTREGRLGLWHFVGASESEDDEMELRWSLQPPMSLPASPLSSLVWAPTRPLLAVLSPSALFLITRQPMLASIKDNTGRTSLKVARLEAEASNVLGRELHPELASLKGLKVKDNLVALWDSERMLIYEVAEDRTSTVTGSFACKPLSVALHGQNVYLAEGGRVEVKTLQVPPQSSRWRGIKINLTTETE